VTAAHAVSRSLRAFAFAFAAATAAFLVVLPSSTALAQPSRDELREQIQEAEEAFQLAVEEYNDARARLEELQAQAEELNNQLAPLQEQIDAAYAETGQMAETMFRGGNASIIESLLSSGSPTTFLEQLATVNWLAANRSEAIAHLQELNAQLLDERAQIDQLIAEQTALEQELSDRRNQLEAEVDRLTDMYEDTYGSTPASNSGGNPPPPPPGANAIVQFAYAQLGEPYVFGAAGPDQWDCSGLTMRAYAQIGVSLAHSVRRQREQLAYVDSPSPGDLIFYQGLGHVGIYVGDGMSIHAPKPGDVVKLAPMDHMPIHSFGRAR